MLKKIFVGIVVIVVAFVVIVALQPSNFASRGALLSLPRQRRYLRR